MKPPVKIVLADDRQVVLDALRLVFSSIPHIEITAALSDSREVVPYLHTSDTDVLVTDLNMPYLSGIDLVTIARQLFPDLKVLLLSISEDPADIREALKAGAHGYVLKSAGINELEKAILALAEGQRYYSEEVMQDLSGFRRPAVRPPDRRAVAPILTKRETEVLKLIAEEFSTAGIAEKLGISVPTVETHRRNLMLKLDVKNLAGLVKYAVRYGLV